MNFIIFTSFYGNCLDTKKNITIGRNGIQWTVFKQLEDLDFADDPAEISTIHRQLQEKLKILNSFSQKTRYQLQRVFNLQLYCY